MKTPEEYAEIAVQNFESGINCSQAVLCAFADDIGMDRSMAAKITSSFGGGMAHGDFCGALTGAFVASGFAFGFDEKMAKERGDIASLKEAQNLRTQKLTKQFTDKHKSYLCKDLLKQAGLINRRGFCKKLVAESAENFARMLQEENK